MTAEQRKKKQARYRRWYLAKADRMRRMALDNIVLVFECVLRWRQQKRLGQRKACKKWRVTNRERIQIYRSKNLRRSRQYRRDYYMKNPERMRAYSKKWISQNPFSKDKKEQVKECMKQYRKTNRRKIVAYDAAVNFVSIINTLNKLAEIKP